MNWDAIAAVSQLVGSIAVVFSVLYLGIQVHRSTRVAKIAAQDAATTALRDVTKPFTENAEIARIWRTGLENLNALPPAEQARFFHVSFQFLKAFESIHYHYEYGLMDFQTWRGWCSLLEHYMVSPGIEHYWRRRHDLFSKRFQDFVANLDRPTQHLTVGNLLGEESSES